jgi:hypothetical protein
LEIARGIEPQLGTKAQGIIDAHPDPGRDKQGAQHPQASHRFCPRRHIA